MRVWGKLVPTLALLAVGLFAAAPAAAQTGSVTGTILDASTGAPLDAVQVSLETVGATETNLGALSQPTGRFLIINVPVGQYVLRAQLLGFGTLTQVVDVAAGQAAVVDLRLEPEAISLSEIVVTGVAGATQRTKLPFDVAQVRVADLPVPTMNAAQSLAGKVAGATVVQGSGRPGSTPSILLRGVTSLDNNGRSQEPLYIVDGVILGSSLVDLDALDIMSIEVVKGAAAASLYGSRAANGVIQIRTKRGAQMADDQVRYTIRSEYGKSELASNAPDLLTEVHEFELSPDGTQFVDVDDSYCDWLSCSSPKLAGQTAGGGTRNEWNTYQTNPWPGRTYDQVARFFEGGNLLQNSLNVEGRSGRTNFNVSVSNLQEDGILRFQEGYNRTTFRVNVDQAVVDNLTIQTSVFYSRSKTATSQGNLFDLTRMPAGVDLLSEDPNEPGQMVLDINPTNNESENALYSLRYVDAFNWRNRFLGSATTRYSPTNWLKFDGTMSFDRADSESETFREKGYRTITPSPTTNDGTLAKSQSSNEALNASVTASVVWNPTDQIRNTTQARYLYESEDYTAFNTNGYDFAVANVPTFGNISSETFSSGSSQQTVRADGYFFITNFDMFDKYILDALVRNDGSSLFGEDERRQWYYRLGGAWRLSQEDWFNIPGIDEFKARYSIGTAGGRPRFTAQYETYNVGGGRISPVNLGNKDLKPEYSTEHEAGLDMSFFNYKAILNLTYAQTTTEDQILQVPQPAFTGFTNQWRNAGTLESRTYEATLDLRILEKTDLSWSAKLLFDNTESKITALSVPAYTYGVGGQGMGAVFYAREGEEVGTFYGVHYANGCSSLPSEVSCSEFVVNDEGWLVWVGEGGSLSNPQWGLEGPAVLGRNLKWGAPFQGVCIDRATQEETTYCVVGNSIPSYNLGLASTVSWKGLSVYALLSRSSNFDIYNQPLQWGAFRRLTGQFDQTGIPQAEQKPVGYYDAGYGVSGLQPSNMYVEDGSFTKLREIALSYRLSQDLLGGVPGLNRFSSIGLNLVGRNLFTWTDYRGYDPDLGEGGGDTGSAAVARVDGYNYPNFRSFTFSVDFIF
jgi:TonB-linked SusC/RagA family outer membrane protein